ncbi:hypothetical protein ACWV26_12885 [Rummeliibacillus sp. JY-2-4R]
MYRMFRNEEGFLLLTALIFLFFVTNLLLSASTSYESHYRAYDALKIAAIDQTKIVLNSIQLENENIENKTVSSSN